MTDLGVRTGTILKIIVNGYVESASPVPSSAVVKGSGLRVSPATVRNEMVLLEGDGYILRPHISAGSVPSDKGYRYYVDALDAAALPHVLAASRIRNGLDTARHEFEAWAEAAAASLADLVGTLAFATTPRAQSASVKAVELLRIQDTIVMLVLVLRETSIHQEILSVLAPVSDGELEHTRNKISEQVRGKTAGEVAAALPSAATALEQRALESTVSVLREREDEVYGERMFQGVSRLLDQPELAARPAQARRVLEAIEDTGTFAALAARAPDDGTPAVMIGSEVPSEDLRDFSVVVSRYGVPDEVQGVVGIVGPTRMPYDRAVPIVRHTANELSTITDQLYRN